MLRGLRIAAFSIISHEQTYFFCGSFVLLSCFRASVHCCLMATCLALVCDVYCVFVIFPCGIRGQVWYLIVSFPDLFHLSYFNKTQSVLFSYSYLEGYVFPDFLLDY